MEREPDSPPAFEPVPLHYRRDGWTPERQRAFIACLWRERCVLSACRHVGKSPEAAYKLFRRRDAASFRAAWDAAFALPGAASAPPPAREPARAAATTRPSSTFSLPSGPSTFRQPLEEGAYSLSGFVRATRASRRRSAGQPPCAADDSCSRS